MPLLPSRSPIQIQPFSIPFPRMASPVSLPKICRQYTRINPTAMEIRKNKTSTAKVTFFALVLAFHHCFRLNFAFPCFSIFFVSCVSMLSLLFRILLQMFLFLIQCVALLDFPHNKCATGLCLLGEYQCFQNRFLSP